MRETIQVKLDEILTLDSGEMIPDAIIELGKTYFGYTIQEDYVNSDFEKNRKVRISLIGYLIRKRVATENTLFIIDEESINILEKLKELNLKVSMKDINLNDGICKKQISAHGYYNEINNKLAF